MDTKKWHEGLPEATGCWPKLATSLGYNVRQTTDMSGRLGRWADTEALVPSWEWED